MGHEKGKKFFSSYEGDQIDALLAAMNEANPLPSGMDWTAFIDDCRAAQSAAEAAAASVEGAEQTCSQSASSAADSANAAHEDADRAEEAAAHVDLPVMRGDGYNSLVVGNLDYNSATAPYSIAGGAGTRADDASVASGISAVAIGDRVAASGANSVAVGTLTVAEAANSIAAGNTCTVYENASASIAVGNHTTAGSSEQVVFGRYNKIDTENKYTEIVGNGSNPGNRRNARTLDRQGNEILAGKLTLGALPTGEMDAVPLSMLFTPLVHDDTLPSDTTAFRKSMFSVNPEWAICVGLYAQNANNDWYQMTPDLFTVPPLIHKRDLRFTLASSAVTSYGGQPFKAVIFYKLPAASVLSQEVQG